MRLTALVRSVLQGGTVAFILSMFVIFEGLVASIKVMSRADATSEALFIRLRIALFLVIVLINGIDNTLFLVVIFSTNLQKKLFICWSLHSLSFLIFFLNIMNDDKLFNSTDACDFIYRVIFYGILIINSLFFLIFMLFVVILSVLIMFFPGLRQRIAFLEQFNDLLLGDFNNPAVPRDPRYMPLNDQELEDMRSIELASQTIENSCSICLLEINEKERFVELANCKHKFHSGCIKLWLRTKPECPLCRMNVRPPATEP